MLLSFMFPIVPLLRSIEYLAQLMFRFVKFVAAVVPVEFRYIA